MKFSHAAIKFLVFGAVDRQYATETKQKHRDCFASWLLPLLGSQEIEAVGITDVLKIRNVMESRRLSSARISSVLSTLKALLNFSRVVLKLKSMNPAEIRLPPKPKPNVKFLTLAEIDKLRTHLSPHRFTDQRTRALMELILGTGVRLSEALRMNREIFEQHLSEIDILGKGGKRRTVFIPEWCSDHMRAFLRQRVNHHPAVFVTSGDPPQRWARGDVAHYFSNLSERTGIKVTPHLLRHTYCTTLLNNGADIMFIKELAGHADIQTTVRYYLGVDKAALRRVVSEKVRYGEADPIDRPVRAG